MNIVYLILAHKNPKQLERLVSKLNGDIFIHIDSKSDLSEFYKIRNNINNKVYFIEDRVSINWGGYSMVEATLNLINNANSNKKYDYFILLSGDDYPVSNLDCFKKFLYKNNGKNFIEYSEFEKECKRLKYRYNNFILFEKKSIFKRILQKLLNLFIHNRPMYEGMVAFKGSQWWCLTNEAIVYILNYIENNKKCLKYFKHTLVPDEMFFQVILLNSPLKNSVINDNLRYILLGDRNHPKLLGCTDLSNIKNGENVFFARKFDYSYDKDIFNELDKLINLNN